MRMCALLIVWITCCVITSAADGRADGPAVAGALPSEDLATTRDPRDFLLLARDSVMMENGPAVIDGSIGVNDPDGLLKIGARNTINGRVVAHEVIFGTGAHVETCEFDVSSGIDPRAVCATIISPIDPPLPISSWPPFPVPPTDPCVERQPDLSVPDGATMALPPGCIGDLRIGRGAVVTLDEGVLDVRSLRLLRGASLIGASSTINVKGLVVTESRVTIKDVTLNSPSTRSTIAIGQRSTVDNVLVNIPNGGVHLHMGVVLINGSEIVAR